ncbi:hypothetical protein E2C01_000556 [Portunus trituberculatus]|uniref:Uncharacterized protein n=1 Tax=Portunus trituberculatus TaxID=210409 RepID=A0A5B7CF05_PORTR|nr:hypothetical protein [Portunus trituberculatus]
MGLRPKLRPEITAINLSERQRSVVEAGASLMQELSDIFIPSSPYPSSPPPTRAAPVNSI